MLDHSKEIKTYSINHLWWGGKKQNDQQFIFNVDNVEELENKFLSSIMQSAMVNQDADIRIWYNSWFNSNDAIKNTEKALEEYSKKNDCHNVKLMDVVTEIPFINANKHIFDKENFPYFCVDTIKEVILFHCLKTLGQNAAIFNDFSVGGLSTNKMTKDQYFDSKSVQQHEEYGITLNINLYSSNQEAKHIVENQHIQIINSERAIEILEYLVDMNLMRATTILNMPPHMQQKLTPIMFYMPHYSITHEFAILFKGLNDETIKVRADCIDAGMANEWITYDPKTHGIKFLGTHLKDNSSKYEVKYEVEIKGKMLDQSEIISGMSPSFSIEDITRETNTRYGNPRLEKSFSTFDNNYGFISWSASTTKFNKVTEDNFTNATDIYIDQSQLDLLFELSNINSINKSIGL